MKIKKFFSTSSKASLTIIILIAIIVIFGTGTVYAASAIAQNSSIGAENAKNFSFADAGIDPTSAKAVQAEFEYEQGQFVYEVEFIADGTEYEYWINASDGTVVKKDIEIVTLDGKDEVTSAQISLEKAKEIALSDAKLTENTVTFTTAKLDMEDSISVYEIEFYKENIEYEYEINASNGTIYSRSKEIQNEQKPIASAAQQPTQSEASKGVANKQNKANSKSNATESVTNKQQAAANLIDLDTAKAKALADADVTASSVTFTEAKLDTDDGIEVYDIEFYTSTNEYEYEINATSGKVHDKSVESLSNNTEEKQSETDKTKNKENSSTYIGIDKAKTIATSHAGHKVSEVTFSKAKLDSDDGNAIYEIEFYKDDLEYEYEVDASSGKILEHDTEQVD